MEIDSTAIFIRLSDIVGADRDKVAIANFELTMELTQPFSLPAVFGAETSAAEDENHRVLSLQFGELPPLGGVVRKLIVGEDSPWEQCQIAYEVLQHLDAPQFRVWILCHKFIGSRLTKERN